MVCTDIHPIPVRCEGMIAPSGVLSNANRVLRVRQGVMASFWPRHWAQTGFFACGKAHLDHRCVAASDLSALHAGAGGARSRAISARMSANICRDTATSASWNVT